MGIVRGASALLLVLACGVAVMAARAEGPGSGEVVDATGSLRVPADYRTAYEFMGSWAVGADQGQGAKELHIVYASPGTTAAYRRDGHFPDGAVLVKEVFSAATGDMTTGTVSHADKLSGWFVMMKDSKRQISGQQTLGRRLGVVLVRC